jgi:hypothetical protein
MKFKRFTRPQFLKGIGREMLGQLCDQFAAALAARQVVLPARDGDEDTYYSGLAALTLTPEGLPDEFVEALLAIEALANAEGQERLERAVIAAGLPLEFPERATHGDMAVQVYLAQPALVLAQHHEVQLGRLSAFEYYGSTGRRGAYCVMREEAKALMASTPLPTLSPGEAERVARPTKETLGRLEAELDAWFKLHQRGHETTRIEWHESDGELGFFVRHGDTFARTAKLEARRLHILHYRPVKEDVVVYAPKWGELRVHAGTKGERELYRRVFGERLFGNAEHFCERKVCTLEPLREGCAAALDPRGLPGVQRIVLREAELAWGRKQKEFLVRGGADIHGSARSQGRAAFPPYGTIVRAVFDFHFTGQKKPRRVEVRTPNTVKLGRGCDPRVVHEWLSANGFRVNVSESRIPNRTEEAVAA